MYLKNATPNHCTIVLAPEGMEINDSPPQVDQVCQSGVDEVHFIYYEVFGGCRVNHHFRVKLTKLTC